METLEEAKEIMEKAGCGKAFAVYSLELSKIAEVRNCNNKGEEIELESNVDNLVSIIEKKLILDLGKPIEYPLNSSMDKYLEFSLKKRSISLCNLDSFEIERIERVINPLLEKYNWSINRS